MVESKKSVVVCQREPIHGNKYSNQQRHCLVGCRYRWWKRERLTPGGTAYPATVMGLSTYLGFEVEAGGCMRRASRMTAWRYGNFDADATSISSSVGKASRISRCNLLIMSGFFNMNQVTAEAVAAVVSLPAKIRSCICVSSSSLVKPPAWLCSRTKFIISGRSVLCARRLLTWSIEY